jgi:hypothetical protein
LATSGAVPDQLPLPALLSAAFVAFTVELDNAFEQRMSDHRTAARRARGQGGQGPYLVSVAMSWTRDRRRYGRLTHRGLNARRRGLRRVRDRQAAWRERFGDELGDAMTPIVGDGTREGLPLLAGLEPDPGAWRADVPAPERLPWFPMVLHRGGWSDGS